MRFLIGLLVLLTAFWLALSGHYTPLLLGLGAASVALVVWLAVRMEVVDHEATPLHITLRLPGFWLWLAWQVLVSALDVAMRVLRGPSALQPAMRRFRHSQQSAMGEATLANAITLTPGTLSVRIDGDLIEVHSVHERLLDDLEAGGMRDRVRRLDLGVHGGTSTAGDA